MKETLPRSVGNSGDFEPPVLLLRQKFNRLIEAPETAMTPLMTVLTARAVLKTAIVLGALAATSLQANAFGFRTKMACAADYYAHCSAYSPGSTEVRSCMRAVGSGLSKGCVAALVADGEVSAAEVSKRRSARLQAAN